MKIQHKRGLAARWTELNPVLLEGEIGVELDTKKIKVGDGTTAWTSLPYGIGATGATGPTGATGAAGADATTDTIKAITDPIDAKAATALTNANAGIAAANAADAKAATALTNAATNYSQLSSSISSLSTVASISAAAATAAQTTADGKNKIFRQGTTPTASSIGDLWFDSSADSKLSKWSGTAWEPFGLGNAAIANLDAGKISTGYLAAGRINANTITASMITAGAIVADKLATNALYGKNIYGANISTVADGGTTVSRVVLDTTGLYAFNGSNKRTFGVEASTGNVAMENATLIAANISAQSFITGSTGARIEMSNSQYAGSYSDAISFYASSVSTLPAQIYAMPTSVYNDNRLVIAAAGNTPTHFSIKGVSASASSDGTGTKPRFEFNLLSGQLSDLAIGPYISPDGTTSSTLAGLLRAPHGSAGDNSYLIMCDQVPAGNNGVVTGPNNTYVSSGESGSLYLRGGKNQTSNQIEIPTNTVSGVKFSGNIYPNADNSGSIGNAALTWNDIYVVNAVHVSDSRTKKDVEPITGTSYGLDFINSLRPVLYKRTGVDKDPVLDKNGVQKEDENGRVWANRDGVRNHTGFIAQEVQTLLDDTEMDWAGWVIGDTNDPDSKQALRYTEFIAPLTAAIQELSAKLEVATEKINDLESRLNNGNS